MDVVRTDFKDTGLGAITDIQIFNSDAQPRQVPLNGKRAQLEESTCEFSIEG